MKTATATARTANATSNVACRNIVDHAAINHYTGFSDVALYNEDGQLIGRQSFSVDGDTPETTEKGRAWRHSEIHQFGPKLTIIQLAMMDAAGEVEHFGQGYEQ